MSGVIRTFRRRPKPLGQEIDAYRCLSCGASKAATADARTFSAPPPLSCCGRDMSCGRYWKMNAGYGELRNPEATA